MRRERFLATFLVISLLTLGAAPKDKDPLIQIEVEPAWDSTLQTSYYTDVASVRLTIDRLGVPFSVDTATGLPANVVDALARWRYRASRPFAVELKIPIRHHLDPQAETSLHKHWSEGFSGGVVKPGLALTRGEAVEIESKLATNEPGSDVAKLLVWYAAQPESADDPSVPKRRAATLTAFINKYPQSPFLAGPYATLNPDGGQLGDTAGYEQIRALWLAKATEPIQSQNVLENAFNFLEVHDPEAAQKMLDRHHSRFDYAAAILMGDLWARAALGVSAVDPRTGLAADVTPAGSLNLRAALLNTVDPRVESSALWALTRDGRALTRLNKLPESYSALCSSVLARWKLVLPATTFSCDAGRNDALDDKVEKTFAQGVLEPPRLVKKVEPNYPNRALQYGLDAMNVYHVIVETDGRLSNICLAKGILMFNSDSLDALKKWRFEPGTMNGLPMARSANIEINFHVGRR